MIPPISSLIVLLSTTESGRLHKVVLKRQACALASCCLGLSLGDDVPRQKGRDLVIPHSSSARPEHPGMGIELERRERVKLAMMLIQSLTDTY